MQGALENYPMLHALAARYRLSSERRHRSHAPRGITGQGAEGESLFKPIVETVLYMPKFIGLRRCEVKIFISVAVPRRRCQ